MCHKGRWEGVLARGLVKAYLLSRKPAPAALPGGCLNFLAGCPRSLDWTMLMIVGRKARFGAEEIHFTLDRYSGNEPRENAVFPCRGVFPRPAYR